MSEFCTYTSAGRQITRMLAHGPAARPGIFCGLPVTPNTE